MTALARRTLPGALGLAGLLVTWEIVGRASLFGDAWPAFTRVLDTIRQPDYSRLLWISLETTSVRAGVGYGIGAMAGLLAAVNILLTPRFEPGMYRLAVLINSVPIIAVAPVLVTTVPRDVVPIIIGAVGVFFTVFVAALSGLTRGNAAQHDLFKVLSSSRRVLLWHLQFPNAIPVILDGLKASIPIAMLGAIFGEWFGAEGGLGVLMINAMDNYRMDLLWATALLASVPTIICYTSFAALESLARKRYPATIAVRSIGPADQVVRPIFQRSLSTVGRFWAVGALLLAWQLWVWISGVREIVMPGPGPVIGDILGNFSEYEVHVMHTIDVALAGLAIGMAAAISFAVVASASPLLGSALLPTTLFMRSVPIVVWTPVLARLTGFNDRTVVVIAALITFFPTFVLAVSGLRSRPPGADDLFHVLAARPWTRLFRLYLPSAMPNLLIALRIAAANAFLAALVGEALIGVQGLGYLFGEARGQFAVYRAWGAVFLASGLAMATYLLANWIERKGHEKWG
jgi:sulfonate transport system permease protein